MSTLAAVVRKSHRLHEQDRVSEITTARVFQVHGDHGVYAVVLSVDGSDAWCSCPSEGACSHVGAVLLTVRAESGG